MSKKIFVDESGGTTINELERFYVIAAIIIDSEQEDLISSKARILWRRLSSGGNLKSNTVGKNVKRRIMILNEINQLMKEENFSYYCFIIDKKAIQPGSPLKFKRTFFKQPHKIFYSKLLMNLNDFDVIIDNHGSKEFMEGFIEYIQRHLDFFRTHQFASDQEYSLLHLSDFIAGSYRRVLEGLDEKETIHCIDYPNVPYDIWPPVFSHLSSDFKPTEFDEIITNISLKSIKQYIEENFEKEEKIIQQQIIVLEHLLYKFFIDPEIYIYRSELVSILYEKGFNMSEQTLSTNIIAPLRTKRVILISTENGIKIPYNAKDYFDWIKRVENQTIPYLKKLLIARDKIQLETGKDILDFYSNPEIKNVLNAIKETVIYVDDTD
ncbi:MAG: DUF3800 domain-containing protein [Candidatus Tenebribacter burtonii]|jgi:hypothetical protein|nr:DUF3800 domain-containing protein [Candidatus Tenebribacter burtonii]